MRKPENNLNSANHSNANQTLTERNAVPEILTLRLAYALLEDTRFFETLFTKLKFYQDILMVSDYFDFNAERKDFMHLKWVASQFAEITEFYDDSDLETMIDVESEILIKKFSKQNKI
jgi:hypothetical protein